MCKQLFKSICQRGKNGKLSSVYDAHAAASGECWSMLMPAIMQEMALPPPSQGRASALTALLGVAHTMFPDNVVKAAVDLNILGVITFALFFGLCLSQLGSEADGLVAAIQVLYRSCLLVA